MKDEGCEGQKVALWQITANMKMDELKIGFVDYQWLVESLQFYFRVLANGGK